MTVTLAKTELMCVVLQTMQAAKATPGILKMCGSQKLLDQLTECNKLLESVQKVVAGSLIGTIHLLYDPTESPCTYICAALRAGSWLSERIVALPSELIWQTCCLEHVRP